MMTIVIICFVLIYVLLTDQNITLWIGWSVFAAGVIISLPFCYLSVKFIRFAAVMVGLLSGASIALVLQNAVVYLISF